MLKSMTAFIEALQAKGRYTFTRVEAMNADKRSDIALEAALRRLKQKGRIANPRRGFYVIVPVEYREAGCQPANWLIDDLMRFLSQPYYVGILSAAAIHGAAHQQPMLFQVVTDRPTRPARAGRVRIGFHMGRHIETAPHPTRGGASYPTKPWRWNFDPPRACHGLAFSRTVADGGFLRCCRGQCTGGSEALRAASR